MKLAAANALAPAKCRRCVRPQEEVVVFVRLHAGRWALCWPELEKTVPPFTVLLLAVASPVPSNRLAPANPIACIASPLALGSLTTVLLSLSTSVARCVAS
jgi:hypothetical protein